MLCVVYITCMMYIVFRKSIYVCLCLEKLSLFPTSRFDYQRISQELSERGGNRPPPLREDDPRRVGGVRLETTTTQMSVFILCVWALEMLMDYSSFEIMSLQLVHVFVVQKNQLK